MLFHDNWDSIGLQLLCTALWIVIREFHAVHGLMYFSWLCYHYASALVLVLRVNVLVLVLILIVTVLLTSLPIGLVKRYSSITELFISASDYAYTVYRLDELGQSSKIMMSN